MYLHDYGVWVGFEPIKNFGPRIWVYQEDLTEKLFETYRKVNPMPMLYFNGLRIGVITNYSHFLEVRLATKLKGL